jgi:hypothetical protein
VLTIITVILIKTITMINVRGNGALLFNVATKDTYAQDWQKPIIAKLSELGIKVYNHQINDIDTDFRVQLLIDHGITTKTNSLFGVLLPDYSSVTSITMLSSYVEQYKTMAVLVIPEYEPDLSHYSNSQLSEANAFVKDVNRMRSYLIDQAKICGSKVFKTIDEALPEFLLTVTKWSNTVGTFGACGNTTWRKNIVNPFLEGANVGHYNPQCEPGTWVESMIAEEEIAKLNCNILFLNLNVVPEEHITTALASQIEAVRFAQLNNRNVVIVYDPALDVIAANLIPNEADRIDYLISRRLMFVSIIKSTNRYLYLVQNFQEGIMTLYSMFRVQKSLNK